MAMTAAERQRRHRVKIRARAAVHQERRDEVSRIRVEIERVSLAVARLEDLALRSLIETLTH
jgi:hypothetical protein